MQHTLKVQLGLTLTVLISLSMLLFGIVLLMLWQRNAIKQETENTEFFLEISAASFSSEHGTEKLPPAINRYLLQNDVYCLQWKNATTQTTQSHGSCPENITLTPLLQKAATGKITKNYSGMVWNGLFFTRRYLLMAIPVFNQKNDIITIGLIRSLEKVSTPFTKIRPIFFAYLIINVLIFGVIGITRLVHLVIRPIRQLAQLADSRADQHDTAFFTSERLGEFTQLSLSLNQLVSRIDGDKQQLQSTVLSLKKANEELENNRDEMVRTEKLVSIGRLSAGLAHEIGNPLGIIQGYVELLSDESLDSDERRIFSQKIIQELDRINNLIRNLLDLSRAQTVSVAAQVDIHLLLPDIIEAAKIRKTSIEITYTTVFSAKRSIVRIDHDGLRQVFLNCILNAIDAIEERKTPIKGEILLETCNGLDDTISISITDNGIGLAEEFLDTVFDPFFTTKEVGKGTGLGLAVTHNMIKSAGGTLQFISTEGTGSIITITLPIITESDKNS